MKIYGRLALVASFAVAGIIGACGVTYNLPDNEGNSGTIAFSPAGQLLAVGNNGDGSSSVTIFKVNNGVLDAGTPYDLNSFGAVLSFSPGEVC